MSDKKLSGLYAITDPALMGGELIAKAKQAILGGIHILQYRNKTASIAQQEKEASTLAALCKKNNILFIINDNVELAIKVDADGVHLGQSDTTLAQARAALAPDKIIGVTCHNNIELAQQAQQQGADYVAFGRFFNSFTKPDAPQASLPLLAQAKKTITVPIVAIGGITPETAPSLLKHGADMLAVIHSIFAADDVLNTTRQFVKLLKLKTE